MYCKKCGKKLDYESDICNECAQNDEFFSAEPIIEPAPQPQPAPVYAEPVAAPAPAAPIDPTNTRKYGIGKAITSIILGFVGYIISYLVLTVLTAIMESPGAPEIESPALMFFVFVSLGLAIPSLILGIKSIITFIKRAKGGYVKPIPTLILGIIGVNLAACVLLFDSVSFILYTLPLTLA